VFGAARARHAEKRPRPSSSGPSSDVWSDSELRPFGPTRLLVPDPAGPVQRTPVRILPVPHRLGRLKRFPRACPLAKRSGLELHFCTTSAVRAHTCALHAVHPAKWSASRWARRISNSRGLETQLCRIVGRDHDSESAPERNRRRRPLGIPPKCPPARLGDAHIAPLLSSLPPRKARGVNRARTARRGLSVRHHMHVQSRSDRYRYGSTLTPTIGGPQRPWAAATRLQARRVAA